MRYIIILLFIGSMSYGQYTPHIPIGVWNNPTLVNGIRGYNTEGDLQVTLNEEFPGYLSDPFYSRIDIDDISTYLPVFLDDVERTTGVSTTTLAKVQEVRDYRGRHTIHVVGEDARYSEYGFYVSNDRIWRQSGTRALTWSACASDGEMIVFFRQRYWDQIRHDNNLNSRIFIMWHEFGHAVLDLGHTLNLSNIMSGGGTSTNECDPATEVLPIPSTLWPVASLYYPTTDCDTSQIGYRNNIPVDLFKHEMARMVREADQPKYLLDCGISSKRSGLIKIED